jgi:hypothetical protein
MAAMAAPPMLEYLQLDTAVFVFEFEPEDGATLLEATTATAVFEF